MSGVGRREAVRRLALGGLGATALPAWAEALVAIADQGQRAPAAADWKPQLLDAHQDATVRAVSELIIPATDTPGAQAALVNRFVDGVLAAAAEPEQREFLRGLRFLDGRSRQLFGADFVSAQPGQQTALLTVLSSDQGTALEDEVGRDFFRVVKALTVAGYYNSEIGLVQELGDSGQMFSLEFAGCRHPEHQ
ncbi:MAG: gluconate 2-dehydrogenase subunit 3 family protein [Vicinamibacteria bacterium]